MGAADVVVVTGGLGPTADDVTRDVVADLLGVPLEESAGIVTAIRARFEARGLQMRRSTAGRRRFRVERRCWRIRREPRRGSG